MTQQKLPIDTELRTQYMTAVQTEFLLADTQHMFGEIGRGSGKTTYMLAPRIDRVANAMPGATLIFANSTFVNLYEDILPTLTEYFNDKYKQGVYFEIGKTPPRHFKKPSANVYAWKNTMSFNNGTVMYFTSLDRDAPNTGKNTAHLFMDEMLKLQEKKVTRRLMKTLRGDASKYGGSCYFGGITGFSSSPDLESDYTWWTAYEQNMDKEAIEEVMYVAKRYHDFAYQVEVCKAKLKKSMRYGQESPQYANAFKKLRSAIWSREKWAAVLNEKRKGQTFYKIASSFSNILNLMPEYIARELKFTKDFDDFATEILSIRKKKVKKKFFIKFSNENIYEDSYTYDRIDKELDLGNLQKLPAHTCQDLKHLWSHLPLRVMIDPGDFFSLIVAQKQPGIYRVLKNFYAYGEQQHVEIAEKFNEFFKYHPTKEIIFDSDRAGNQKKHIDPVTGQKDDTDAKIIMRELEKYGWYISEYRTKKMATVYHDQQYNLMYFLFGEFPGFPDKILIDKNECAELISSINFTPLKDSESIQMDKRAETKLSYEEQILYSPQLASALIYGLHGEYWDIYTKKYSRSTVYDIPTIAR